jgi:hypothetical protein
MPVLTNISIAKTLHGTVEYVAEEKTVILAFKGEYVPLQAFKELLAAIESLAAKQKINKMIFDKRSLKVFHQPSMEWYHLEWKPSMLQKGLKTYRKVLPQDELFRQSVRVGREKISKQNPYFDFKKFDIKYCESVEAAFNS